MQANSSEGKGSQLGNPFQVMALRATYEGRAGALATANLLPGCLHDMR